MKVMSSSRMALAFHESFALSLPSIAAVLRLSHQNSGLISSGTIRAQTSLGPNYVKAMPRYARACGLMEMGSYRLTPFGEAVCRHDPHLTHPATLWLMHYHLSAPHGPGPAFWSHLVTRCLPFGEEIAAGKLASEISRSVQDQGKTRPLQERTVRSSATIFIGTYTKSDGLGSLGLLEECRGRGRSVRVADPQSPPPSALACALADYWSFHYGDQVTLRVSELAKADGFARVMWMDPQRLDVALEALRLEGVLDLHRVAPPHQVVRLWSSNDELLARLYD